MRISLSNYFSHNCPHERAPDILLFTHWIKLQHSSTDQCQCRLDSYTPQKTKSYDLHWSYHRHCRSVFCDMTDWLITYILTIFMIICNMFSLVFISRLCVVALLCLVSADSSIQFPGPGHSHHNSSIQTGSGSPNVCTHTHTHTQIAGLRNNYSE